MLTAQNRCRGATVGAVSYRTKTMAIRAMTLLTFFRQGASEKIDIIVPVEDDESELAEKLANVCQNI